MTGVPQAMACSDVVPAGSYWHLDRCLPTGPRHAVDAARDLNAARRFSKG